MADIKYIVRIMNTDLSGKVPIGQAMTKIKGVSSMFSNAVCKAGGIIQDKKTGELGDAEVKNIEDIIKNPAKYNIPSWLMNRKRDPETGEDRHILTSDLDFIKQNDLKQKMKLKTYQGVRHSARLTVRGQRTKSNFRRGKGKASLGVARKKK